MTFEEYIQKHQIGPSMNQRYYYERAELPIPEGLLYDWSYDGKVGDGWVSILEALTIQLKKLGWGGQVNQIKEKFGGLRFYADLSTLPMSNQDIAFALINQAENLSLKRCEDCGSEDHVSTRPLEGKSWIRTLCQQCRNT